MLTKWAPPVKMGAQTFEGLKFTFWKNLSQKTPSYSSSASRWVQPSVNPTPETQDSTRSPEEVKDMNKLKIFLSLVEVGAPVEERRSIFKAFKWWDLQK